jgi:ABC-type antimicrobial peptide transport system permease subunit
MSRETGERLFGEKDNCYYVILGGAKEDEFISDLSKLGFDISFERSEASMSNTASMRDILNTVILGLSFMAIFMMGIIMTNLTNIFVSKRLKDIAIMRINGFSMKETMMYLARETIIINLIGIASGVVVGSTVAYIIIRMMEQPDMMLARSFSIPAWIIAVVLTALASLVINAIAFRKTKKLSLTDAK